MQAIGMIAQGVVLALGVAFVIGCYVLQEDRYRERKARKEMSMEMTETRSPTIIVRDALRAAVEKATDGEVTVLYDEAGLPSYMLVVPRFDVSDIDAALGKGTHPAFVVDGAEKSEIFVGQVPATMIDGAACSLPSEEARYYSDFDEARAACAKKGKGWHLLTAWEWAAVVFWVVENRSKHFVKNYWEWNDGLKLVDGKLHFPTDNAFEMPEADWPFQGAAFDAADDEPVLSAEVSSYSEEDPRGAADDRDEGYTSIGDIKGLELSESYKALGAETRERMARLMIEPATRAILSKTSGGLFVRNYGERIPVRGGDWSSGAGAGLAALSLISRRSLSTSSVGFRPAFIL
jgi:hypothetical protein